MINKQKIIIMTKLAVYDKNNGDKDRLANSYFRHDYIYRQNIRNRVGAFIGSIILLAVYWLHRIFIAGDDIFSLDIQKYIINSAIFVIAVMLFYTVVGTLLATRRYYLCQKRLEQYGTLVHQLERLNERAKREEVSDLYYGADADRKRDRY